MNRLLIACAIVSSIGFVENAACQTAPIDSMRVWRESLRAADMAASAAAVEKGFAEAFPLSLADDAVLLWQTAPVIRGRSAIQQLLAAQPPLHVSWQPIRVVVSSDGRFGATFGATSRYTNPGVPPAIGHYISLWTRVGAENWKIVANAQVGVVPAREVNLPQNIAGAVGSPQQTQNPFAAADLAFANMAADSGAPAAFYHFSAPEAMTFAPTGELNVGASDIRARVAEGQAGKSRWEWRPIFSVGSAAGDLGATIGTAEIRSGPNPEDVFFSKYLTVWQRQPDGSLKFIVDGGSARPAKKR